MTIGEKYGKWTILSFSGLRGKGGNAHWLCRCECGTTKELSGSKLRLGKTTQCHKCSGRKNGRKGLYSMSKKHLYVIRAGEYIKIGSSDNPERRIRDIESDNPYQIDVLKILENQGHLEQHYHEKHKQYAHRGEWFKMKLDQLKI